MATNPNNAIGTNAAFSGRTSPNAFNDVLAIFGGRGIVTGWECAPSQNMVITVGGQSGARDVAIAQDNAANKLTIDNISQQPIEVEIAAASTTSVSKDCIVAYVNNPPQGEATVTDNPGACGIIDVRGSTGEVPTEDQIRSAITADGATGATAYYVVLATITVPAGATTITASNITQGGKAIVNDQNIDFPTPQLAFYGENKSHFGISQSGWSKTVTLDIPCEVGKRYNVIGTAVCTGEGTLQAKIMRGGNEDIGIEGRSHSAFWCDSTCMASFVAQSAVEQISLALHTTASTGGEHENSALQVIRAEL